MRIARLELFGFKSFPDRTTFHFGGGISCVVGPNGSGKSNVVDALKWCIGEMSARSLRGAEMTDVIFAGSTDRKPVGFAEVVLSVVADGEPFPGEYAQMHELQVGRRLHRSGASEYLINQTKVRRRDVVELLMDSGIGNNLYAFVEQGQIDKMISATPIERRSVIDEAAGISRYKARREEAVQRLEATAGQLDRAADVVDEMARHKAALEKQVVRTAEFRRIRALVRLGELRLALAKHAALAGDRRGLRERLERSRADEDIARREALRREEDIVERREELAVVQTSLGARRDAVAEIDARIREHAASAGHLEQRRTELLAERDRASADGDAHDQRAAGADAEAAEAAGELERLREREAVLRAEGEARAGALEAVRRRVVEQREGVGRGEEAVREALGERIAAEAAAAAARTSIADRRAAEAELDGLLRGLAAELEAVEVRGTSLAEERERADAALAAAGAEVARAEAALVGAVARVEEADRRVRAEEAEREGAAARGRRWIAAAVERWDRDVQALALAWDARITAAEREAREAVEGSRREAAARGRAEVEAVERRDAAHVAAATGALREAEEAVTAARAASEVATAEQARRGGERAATAAELASIRASLEPADAVLAAVLGELVPLVRAVPEGMREAVARRLGDRAGLPVVRTAGAVIAVAAALAADRVVSFVYWPEGAPVPGEGVGEGRSLADALGGGAAVGEGFRIDADGVVTLGAASAFERMVARERVLAERLPVLEEAIAAGAVRIEAAAGAVRDAASGRDRSVAALAEARSAATRASDERRTAARGLEAQAEAEARAAGDLRLAGLRAERDGVLGAARAERTRAVGELERELEQALAVTPKPARDTVTAARGIAEGLREERDRALAARVGRERERDAIAASQVTAGLERGRIGKTAAERTLQRDRARAAAEEAGRALEAQEARRRTAAEAEAHGVLALDGLRSVLAEVEREESGSRDRTAAADIERATVGERIAATGARAAAAARRGAEARSSASSARESATRLGAAADAAEVSRLEAIAAGGRLSDERGAAWDALERERVRATRLEEALRAAEEALRAVRERSADQGKRSEGLAGQLAAVQAELEVLRRGMEDRYQVSLPALLDRLHARGELLLEVDAEVRAGLTIGAHVVAGVEPVVIRAADLSDEEGVLAAVSDLDALRTRLGSLGEVNLGATAEYQELERRHGELEAQRADLEQSVVGIRAAIAKLNRLCRERFRETFDRVNEHVQEVYPKLVGGGSARLSLTDDEDLLETGVDIFVQPPGKRLQNLQLLSGGEKAMTAIALIISLFRVKPAPFCVLDEVDAPLDEANGARFNEMLKEMSRRSQFLVITHNRKTMECADTLYGVTMARPGVSRLVSVDLSAY